MWNLAFTPETYLTELFEDIESFGNEKISLKKCPDKSRMKRSHHFSYSICLFNKTYVPKFVLIIDNEKHCI